MSDMETETAVETQPAPPRELSRGQRRVLGVLLEKAFTTPEYYPMTLKALTAGCNQKSNRDPVANYNEDSVEQLLDELRQIGLVAVVHTESGRTERFRHYVRKRYPFNEPQLAILTELLLRGRQQLGELRSRASRMVPIDGLQSLRTELTALQESGFVQAGGPLERRGIEVDHAFYTESEAARQERPAAGSTSAPPASADHAAGPTSPPRQAEAPDQTGRFSALEATVTELVAMRTQLTGEIDTLKQQVESLSDDLRDLKDSLGS